MLIILGLAAALTGGFVLVCGVPFISHKLCRLGGTLLIAAGKLFAQFSCVVSVHVYMPVLQNLHSAVRISHSTAADVALPHCCYSNSRFKHCSAGGSCILLVLLTVALCICV